MHSNRTVKQLGSLSYYTVNHYPIRFEQKGTVELWFMPLGYIHMFVQYQSFGRVNDLTPSGKRTPIFWILEEVQFRMHDVCVLHLGLHILFLSNNVSDLV